MNKIKYTPPTYVPEDKHYGLSKEEEAKLSISIDNTFKDIILRDRKQITEIHESANDGVVLFVEPSLFIMNQVTKDSFFKEEKIKDDNDLIGVLWLILNHTKQKEKKDDIENE